MMATNDTALTMKQAAVPTVTINTPAIAGPTMREPWISELLRPIAFGRSAGGHQFRDERLARGLVDGERHTEQEDEDIDHPELDGAGEVEHREQGRDHGHRHLGGEEELPLVEPVGKDTSPDAEHERRQVLQCDREPDGQPVLVRQLEHQPHDGDRLHDGAAVRDQLAVEVEPEVADAQGAEGVRGTPHGSSSMQVLEDRQRRVEPRAFVVAQARHALREERVLAGATPREERTPVVGDRDARRRGGHSDRRCGSRSPTRRAGRRCASCSVAARAPPRPARRA